MAEFKVLHFQNTSGGQRAKIRSLQRYSEAGWTVVSETLEQGKFKGGDACCLGASGFACCGPVGLLGACTAGHTTGTITVTLTRQTMKSPVVPATIVSGRTSPKGPKTFLVGCLVILIGGSCLLVFVSILGNSPEPPRPESAHPSRQDNPEIPLAPAPVIETQSQATPKAETMPAPVESDTIQTEIPIVRGREEASKAEHQNEGDVQIPNIPVPGAEPSSLASIRTWTDSSGKYTVEAEFVNFENGEVRLKKPDGNIISIAPSKLSAADREHLKTIFGIEVEKKMVSGQVTAVSDKRRGLCEIHLTDPVNTFQGQAVELYRNGALIGVLRLVASRGQDIVAENAILRPQVGDEARVAQPPSVDSSP